MNKKTILFIIAFTTAFSAHLSAGQRVPLFVRGQNKVFSDLAKSISQKLPQNVKLLVYDLNFLNGPDELKDRMNEGLQSVLVKLKEKYAFLPLFEKDIDLNSKNINIADLKKDDEMELIALGKFLGQDAVMLSSVTVMEGKTRLAWDRISKRPVKMNVVLFQGNIFNENRISLFRFSYFFLID